MKFWYTEENAKKMLSGNESGLRAEVSGHLRMTWTSARGGCVRVLRDALL